MIVKAVTPYYHPNGINFKTKAYEAWLKVGGRTAKGKYPWRLFHRFAFEYEIPVIKINNHEARLRFVQPVSIKFDTFPDYAFYEIIPLIWDCWPAYFEKTLVWLQRHKVKTAIFTSSQVAEMMRDRLPEMNILTITEGVDTKAYKSGIELVKRPIDVLEFGRPTNYISKLAALTSIRFERTIENGRRRYTSSEFQDTLCNSKLTVCIPRCMSQPEVAGDIETLTQRYWECMLSRIVMIGHAPKELTDLVGYNPVIEMDKEHVNEQMQDILAHINEYQELVDKNREAALRHGDWTLRVREVMTFFKQCGYSL